MTDRPDIVIMMTDEERAIPPYESDDVLAWRQRTLSGRRWFDEHGVSFTRHYTGSLACVPSRPTIFTGQYPGSARRHPDRRHRQALRRLPAAMAAPGRGAHAGQLVPRGGIRHPLRRQVAHLPRRPDDPATGRVAGHQRRRRRRRPGRGAALSRRRPACALRLLGLGGPRAAWRANWPTAVFRRDPSVRRPSRRLAERPLRAASRR